MNRLAFNYKKDINTFKDRLYKIAEKNPKYVSYKQINSNLLASLIIDFCEILGKDEEDIYININGCFERVLESIAHSIMDESKALFIDQIKNNKIFVPD